jgi:uncharacterized membrane protein (UPF0136 family)
MTKFLATFRDASSFIAGLLVGLSIAVAAFAMMDGDWQALSVFGAPIILALGIALQVIATYKPRDVLPVQLRGMISFQQEAP